MVIVSNHLDQHELEKLESTYIISNDMENCDAPRILSKEESPTKTLPRKNRSELRMSRVVVHRDTGHDEKSSGAPFSRKSPLALCAYLLLGGSFLDILAPCILFGIGYSALSGAYKLRDDAVETRMQHTSMLKAMEEVDARLQLAIEDFKTTREELGNIVVDDLQI